MNVVTTNQEILQVALMRGCWSSAEAIFANRIRAICRDWAEGDIIETNRLAVCLLRGDRRKVPAELSFAVAPLVETLDSLRKSRVPVDSALRLAIDADPEASGKAIQTEVPEGYISFAQASKSLGRFVSGLPYGIRCLAYAYSVRVIGQGRGRRRYFRPHDIETARQMLEEEESERMARQMRNVARRHPKAPPDAIPLHEVARRLGMSYSSLRDAIDLRPSTLPPMHKIGARWFAFESDLREFPAEPQRRQLNLEKINHLKAQGYLQTRDAAERIGRSHRWVIEHGRREGIKPERFDHVALYAPADLDRLVAMVGARHNERIEQNRAQKAANQAVREAASESREAAREKRAKLVAIHAAAVAARQIPAEAIPIKDVLAAIGMERKRFDKIRLGLSGTPIPCYCKAGNGQVYCMPDDLAAFLADPQLNRMLVVADPEYRKRERSRKNMEKRYAKVKRRYRNAVSHEAWM